MALDWTRDGATWPHREHSAFVAAGGQRWHVQRWPAPWPGAPLWLLLHGTGSSTHSWRRLAPLLAPHAALLACDLPGHAFSEPAPGDGAGLTGMARGVAAVLSALSVTPDAIVGHSAGAAIALRMALDATRDKRPPPPALVGINAALFPLPGIGGALFPPAARLLAMNPAVPHLFAWRVGSDRVLQQLLRSTGSAIDAEGAALYRRLVTNPGHVAGALAMVSRWDLPALARMLPQVRTPLHLIVGDGDRTVPPSDSRRAQALVPGAVLHRLPGLGHLAHEEAPETVAGVVLAALSPKPQGGAASGPDRR